jgi:hypothetical protein
MQVVTGGNQTTARARKRGRGGEAGAGAIHGSKKTVIILTTATRAFFMLCVCVKVPPTRDPFCESTCLCGPPQTKRERRQEGVFQKCFCWLPFPEFWPIKTCLHQNKAVSVAFGKRPRLLHDRYTRTDTYARWGMAIACSRYKFVAVSLLRKRPSIPKPPCGGFRSKTATWIPLGLLGTISVMNQSPP